MSCLFFFSKQKKTLLLWWNKSSKPFDNKIMTQGLRGFPGKMERSASFKDNSAECGFAKCSLAAVRKAFMLLQTWQRDNEFLLSSDSLRGYDSNPSALVRISLLSSFSSPGCHRTTGHSWLLLILIKVKSKVYPFLFVVVVYCTRVPLMLAPECPLNSLSGRRQKTIFVILSTKKVEIWRTLSYLNGIRLRRVVTFDCWSWPFTFWWEVDEGKAAVVNLEKKINVCVCVLCLQHVWICLLTCWPSSETLSFRCVLIWVWVWVLSPSWIFMRHVFTWEPSLLILLHL